MQNVVNLHCPFLLYGTPIVDGRVYFVKVDTAAQTFDQLAGLDDAFFINVYDKDGNDLANPLSLDSEGRFSVQPFVEDDTDFKMIVCRPTGISEDLNDETPAWDVAYTMVSKSQHVTVDYQGIAKVDSIAALRQQDSDVGAVLVLGYSEANDFCPPRIFTWKQETLTDNGGTHIRSTKQGQQNAGTWVCEPSHHVDVRWFGVEPGMASNFTDCWTTLNNIVSTYYPSMPLYLRRGYYNISGNLTINSGLILDNGSKIRPLGRSVTLTVNNLDNRGGTFLRARVDEESSYYNVYPKVSGELRTSWMSDPAEQISSDVLANVTELVFDSNVNFSSATTISHKKVLVKSGSTVQNAVFDGCLVFYESAGAVDADDYRVSGKASINAETAHLENGLVVKSLVSGNFQKVLEIFKSQSEFFSGLKAEHVIAGDEVEEGFSNGFYENPDYFAGAMALFSQYGYFKDLLSTFGLSIRGGISHAWSWRPNIVLTINQVEIEGVPQLQMSVTKDEEYVGVVNPTSRRFSLTGLNIFNESRDYDILVTTTVTNIRDNFKINLPTDLQSQDKIFAFNYAPLKTGTGNDSPIELVKNSNEKVYYNGQDEQYETGGNRYENSFFGHRIVRKTANGDWFFDPFAI